MPPSGRNDVDSDGDGLSDAVDDDDDNDGILDDHDDDDDGDGILDNDEDDDGDGIENDIIFRLAYFERKHQFFNLDDLTSEITCHYTSQAIKQMYVVLLGLDVLGNPFGLVVGVARSVEDLFYEPFQGAA